MNADISDTKALHKKIEELHQDVQSLREEVEQLRSTAFWANLNVKWAEAFVRPILDGRKKISDKEKQKLVDAYFENSPDA